MIKLLGIAAGLRAFTAVAVVAACAAACAKEHPDPPGQPPEGTPPKYEAYLFAHMTDKDYGRLYYSVSTDGLHWKALNGGERVFREYRGHPDICKGHDGRYYLVGNRSDETLEINFWVSTDLIRWEKYGDYTPDLTNVPGYPDALRRVGAPKISYDTSSSQYLLTWHTPHVDGVPEDPERYWASQRTLYVTSKDLKEFSAPVKRLFSWDMATIDVFVRKIGDRYYAILKDERYPSPEWVTGKTIRIASAPDLLGPYSDLSPPLSPNFREAPMLIPSPDGKAWYLYYEQYPGMSYGVSLALDPNGPWHQLQGATRIEGWNKYSVPKLARHGCMLPISKAEYNALVEAYSGKPSDKDTSTTATGAR